MKKNVLTKIFFSLFVFSFTLFMISFCTGTEVRSPKSVNSALVNPAHRENIRIILIQSPQGIISLKNENDIWSAEEQGIHTFAEEKNIESLIKNLTKIRKMYKISDSLEAKIDLSLTQDSAKIITIIDNRGLVVSKLYFGLQTALTSRINLCTENAKVCYETEDNISAYLHTDIDFWTKPEIFFAVKNPSNLNIPAADLSTLLSLRHGKVLLSQNVPYGCTRIDSVTLIGQFNSFQTVDFYSRKNDDGTDEYFYIQHIEPETITNNAVYEISGWTYSRLTTLLKR